MHHDRIVKELCMDSGLPPHPNHKARAYKLGLSLRPRRRLGAELRGLDVYYDRRLPEELQQELVGLCVATYGLRRRGLREDAQTVELIAAGLSRQERRRSGLFLVGAGS